MNAYLRNSVITLMINIVVFILGWTCIVPDTLNDQTHLFGLIGDVEITKGNTATVFAVCCILSTLVMMTGMIEAIAEDLYRRPRFNPTSRVERPRKTPKLTGMRITDPTSPESIPDEDPKTPLPLE